MLHYIGLSSMSSFKGVYKSLVKGGRLLFQMAGKGNAQDVLAVIQEMIAKSHANLTSRTSLFPMASTVPRNTTNGYRKPV